MYPHRAQYIAQQLNDYKVLIDGNNAVTNNNNNKRMITLDNKLKEFNNKFMNTKANIDEKMNKLTSDMQRHSGISNDLAERVNEHILKTTAQWKEQTQPKPAIDINRTSKTPKKHRR